jgi:hypothetical protein
MDGQANRTRPIMLRFFVTKAERDMILEKMRLLDTENLSAYLRKMAIDGYIIVTDFTAAKETAAQIQKVGVNVNQIARRVNTVGYATEQDLKEVKEALAEIWRLQRLSLSKAR